MSGLLPDYGVMQLSPRATVFASGAVSVCAWRLFRLCLVACGHPGWLCPA